MLRRSFLKILGILPFSRSGRSFSGGDVYVFLVSTRVCGVFTDREFALASFRECFEAWRECGSEVVMCEPPTSSHLLCELDILDSDFYACISRQQLDSRTEVEWRRMLSGWHRKDA